MAYTWPDGSKNHSVSWATHQANLAAQNANTQAAAQQNQGYAAQVSTGPPKGLPQQAPVAAAPAAAPQPYDPGYEAYKLSAGRNVTLGNNEATWQTQNLGYDSGINADGTLNAANPYSQAQLLQDNYKRSQMGADTSLGSQGHYYSGSRLNAQGTNDRNYAQGYAGLQRGASTGYHNINATQLGNYANNAVGVSGASFDSLNKATYGG